LEAELFSTRFLKNTAFETLRLARGLNNWKARALLNRSRSLSKCREPERCQQASWPRALELRTNELPLLQTS